MHLVRRRVGARVHRTPGGPRTLVQHLRARVERTGRCLRSPWIAKAWAPTTTNSTACSNSSDRMSWKSSFTRKPVGQATPNVASSHHRVPPHRHRGRAATWNQAAQLRWVAALAFVGSVARLGRQPWMHTNPPTASNEGSSARCPNPPPTTTVGPVHPIVRKQIRSHIADRPGAHHQLDHMINLHEEQWGDPYVCLGRICL
jgi:hypothetical protein